MGSRSHQSIVVLTDRRDAHLPFVQRHLDDPLVILDPRSSLDGGELTYLCSPGRTSVIADGEVIDNVRSVWFRKPINPTPEELPVDGDYAHYSTSALREHYAQLFSAFADALWVSDFYKIRQAGSKVYQLTLATKLGFSTLSTVFTSSPARAESFIRQHARVVVKPISTAHPKVRGEQQVLFTTLIRPDQPPDLTNLHLAPSIFQVAPEVAFDARVIVVGDQAFPAKITNTKANVPTGVSDARVGHYVGGLDIAELPDFPDDLATLCVDLVRRMGLRFGAIDLLCDTAGRYWFLENNPNGQWAYVENVTGQSIGRAIAELLAGSPVDR